MVKRSVICAAVAAMALNVSAQSARVTAMGGCSAMGDISGSFGSPYWFGGYKDVLHGTASGTEEFDIFATKSLGKVVTLGFIADRDGAGKSPFGKSRFMGESVKFTTGGDLTSDSVNLITDTVAGKVPNPYKGMDYPEIPNLLLHFDFGKVGLGIEGFYDISRNTVKNEIKNTAGTSTYEEKLKFSRAGALIQLGIKAGDAIIAPLGGFGVPVAKYWGKNVPFTGATTEGEVKSKGAFMWLAGIETVIPMGQWTAVPWVRYNHEKFGFEAKANNKTTEDPTTYRIGKLSGALGASRTINNLVTVAEYQIGITKTSETKKDTTAEEKTSVRTFSHTFCMGLERPINKVWIFDAVTPRAGFNYTIDKNRDKFTSKVGSTDIKNKTGHARTSGNGSDGEITCGLGFKKNAVDVDLALNIGDWGNGVIAGPSAASVSFTFDFGKIKGGKAAAAPAAEAAPAE